MVWNISCDEVRHIAQFKAMIEALGAAGASEGLGFRPHPERDRREDDSGSSTRSAGWNELTHRYLRYVMMFSGDQDLSQRLFKNSVNHMRHWDKLAGIVVKMGDVIAIETAATDAAGVERSREAFV